MQVAHKARQRGMTFLGLLFVAVVVACVAMVVIRVAPTVVEYQSIVKAINQVKTESTPAEARAAFDRAASVGYFDAISGADLDIAKRGGSGVGSDNLKISFAYRKQIHLFGPASLVLDYTGSTQ